MTNKARSVAIGCLFSSTLLFTGVADAIDREDLLFYASFDGTLKADYARGSSAPKAAPNLAFADGVAGQGVVALKGIAWDGKDNIVGKEGTFSFWLSPVDWSTGGNNHNFVFLNAANGAARIYQFFNGTLGMLMQTGKGNITCMDYIGVKKGEFTQITFTWRPGEWALYINGLLVKKVSDSFVPFGEIGSFQLGADNTLFDELFILRRAITEEEAKAHYYRTKSPEAAPFITIPKTSSAISIDGKIDGDEYDSAAKSVGWTDAILGVANDDPTSTYLTYDKENLYCAFTFPVPDKYRVNPVEYVNQPIAMKTKEADSPDLFLDDYVEVVLSPEGTEDIYRIALNGASCRFDAKNGAVSWNGNWKFQTHFDDDFWKVEVALPFAGFGRSTPATGEQWRVNLKHHAAQVIEMDSVWAYRDSRQSPMGALVFGGEMPAIQIEKISNPSGGQIEIEAKINPGASTLSGEWELDTDVSTSRFAELKDDKGLKPLSGLDVKSPQGYENRQKIALKPGNIATVNVSHLLPHALAADLVVIIKDQSGKDLLVKRSPFAFTPRNSIDVSMLPSVEKIIVALDCSSPEFLKTGVSAVISIRDEAGNQVRSVNVEKVGKGKQAVEIDIKGLSAGKYHATATLFSGSLKMPEMKKDFEIMLKPEWFGTKVGIGEDVLAPWTPLESAANSITCWGRKYTYADSVFPSKIEILGKDILALPIVLKIKEDGKVSHVSNAKLEFKGIKPNRIEFSLSGSTGSFDVKTENWIEYDGFIWVKIVVTPRKTGATMEELFLEFPYNKEIVTHWYNGQYSLGSPTGYLPKEKYVSAPASFARFGDAERGLQWCWEHTYTWHLSDSKNAMELIPEADRYRVRLKLVDHSIAVDKPMEIEIGLQALPSRPQPKGYHGPYWGGGRREGLTNKDIPMVNLWAHHWFLFNNPNLTAEPLTKARERIVKNWQTLKLMGCIYSSHQNTSPMSPEYRYFGEEWRSIPSDMPNFKALDAMDIGKARRDHSGHICYGSESYTDFYLYYLQKSLKYFHGENPEIPIGLYYDNSGAASCRNTHHGHGFLIDGEYKPVKAILAWRRACERIRRVLKGVDPDTSWYTVHMSGIPAMAHWSFNDIMIPGEQYASFFSLKKAQAEAAGKEFPYDYTQMCELDRVRAEYSSLGFGPAQVFLSETWQWTKQATPEQLRKADRHLFGLLFVNDVMPWGSDSAKAPVLEALWEHLGWDDKIVFYPYWRNQQYLNMKPYDENKIVASIFAREGKACIFAFNNTDDEVKADFDLKLDDIGVKRYGNGRLVDPIAQKEYVLSGTKATVTLPKRDFQIFFLK